MIIPISWKLLLREESLSFFSLKLNSLEIYFSTASFGMNIIIIIEPCLVDYQLRFDLEQQLIQLSIKLNILFTQMCTVVMFKNVSYNVIQLVRFLSGPLTQNMCIAQSMSRWCSGFMFFLLLDEIFIFGYCYIQVKSFWS